MDNLPKKIVSAIVGSERRLETIINRLLEKSVARHDISIQGPPNQLIKEYGKPFLQPKIIQKSDHAPTKRAFLDDDFGWVLGLAIGIPVFLGMVITLSLFGDLHSDLRNFGYAAIGAAIGAIAGALFSWLIKRYRTTLIHEQEKQGGFVLWITATEDHIPKIMAILKKYHAREIRIESETA